MRTVKLIIDVVAPNGARASNTVKSSVKSMGDEVSRINKQTAEDAKRTAKVIEHATKERIREELKAEKRLEQERKRIADNFIKSINRSASNPPKPPSSGGSDFVSTLFGGGRFGSVLMAGSVGGAVAAGILLVSDSVKQLTSSIYGLGEASLQAGARYERVQNALTAAIGSSSQAKAELKAINEVARSTAGLRLESAEQGYQRLRVLGFEASRAKRIIKELGEEKFLSGATDDAVEKVLFNFVQIASGGQTIGQELREILTQMPSLQRGFLQAFGTLSGKKIQSQLENLGTDAFFDKLLTALEKQKVAVGGVEGAYGKLIDEFIIVGRELSLPVIPTITKDLQDLSQWLRDNQSKWSSWGNNIKVVYEDVREFIKSGTSENKDDIFSQIGRGVNSALYYQLNPIIRKYIEGVQERAKPQTSDSIKEMQRLLKEQTEAADLAIAQAEMKREQEEERKRQLELSKIKDVNTEKLSQIKHYYGMAEILASAGITLTSEQEISQLRKLSGIKKSEIDAEIKNQTAFYNRQIFLNEGNKDAITKLTLEKNQELRKLNLDLLKNETETAKRIREIQRQQLEKSRQDAIQFKQLQIREFNANFGAGSFDLNRSIGLGNNGFSALSALTQKNFNDVVRITREQYQIQLQNERLTTQERVNLNKQMYLDIQDLAEQNRQKQIEIQDNLFNYQVNRIEKLGEVVRDSYQAQSALYGSINQFLNPSTFNQNTYKALRDVFVTPIEEAENKYRELQQRQMLVTNGTGDVTTRIPQNKLKELIGDANEAFKTWERLKKSVSGVTSEIMGLAKGLTDGTKGISAFDEASKKLLESQHRLQKANLESEIDTLTQLIQLEQSRGKDANQEKLLDYTNKLRKTQNSQSALSLTQASEKTEQYSNSLEGLRATLGAMVNGEGAAWIGLLYELEKRDLNKSIGQAKSIIESQKDLANKAVFNPLEANARVLEHLNSQTKSVTDIFVEMRTKIVDNAFDGIDKGLDRLTKKLGLFGDFIKTLASGILKQFASGILQKLFGLQGNQGFSLPQQGGGSIFGGLLGGGQQGGGILGGLFGGGFTPTGGFAGGNPVASILGGGQAQGGILGKLLGGGASRAGLLGGLFGGGGITATATAGGLTTTGTLATSLTLPSGATATAGGGALGGLTPLLTNPITAIVAGAAIGGFFLWRHFRNKKMLNQLKEAAQSAYGISVKDKSVLEQLKQIGEGQFGKGQAGKRAAEVVRLEQAKEVLSEYATQTGQNSNIATKAQLADENWKGNRFVSKFGGFREMGGSVRAGYAYVVGEKRPELFVPNQNGTIQPSVNIGANAQTQVLVTEIAYLKEAVSMLVGKLSSMSPNDILSVADNSAFGDKLESAFSSLPNLTQRFRTNTEYQS